MQFNALNHTSERAPVASFGMVKDLEKDSLLKKGMKEAYGIAFYAASVAIEATLGSAKNVTGEALDSLSSVAPKSEGGK